MARFLDVPDFQASRKLRRCKPVVTLPRLRLPRLGQVKSPPFFFLIRAIVLPRIVGIKVVLRF